MANAAIAAAMAYAFVLVAEELFMARIIPYPGQSHPPDCAKLHHPITNAESPHSFLAPTFGRTANKSPSHPSANPTSRHLDSIKKTKKPKRNLVAKTNFGIVIYNE